MDNLNNNAKNATKTIFCDIDGTLVEFPQNIEGFKNIPKGIKKMKLLPGALDKLWEWETQGYRIILTTGRKESMREVTERQLTEAGIFWDQLVMGLGPGKRYLINDINNGSDTAFAVNVKRNEGIGDVVLPESNHSNIDAFEDILCPPPEPYPFTGEAAESEAVKIAESNYVKAMNDLREVQPAIDHFNKHVL